jgi:hypothetical protein
MRNLLLISLLLTGSAYARDLNGQYNDSPLKGWFNTLQSGKGLCCSVADGRTVDDPDWGDANGHYWVVVDGTKYVIPDDALVRVPNKAGRAIVWPATGPDGGIYIRCFIPGAEG